MLQCTHILFEHDMIGKQAKLILIRLLIGGLLITEKNIILNKNEQIYFIQNKVFTIVKYKLILTLVLQLGTRRNMFNCHSEEQTLIANLLY